MAMTNASPLDYRRRKGVGKPQKIKLCDACGAPIVYHREYRCTSCPNKSYVIVYETEAADFRLDLMVAEEQKAEMIALEIRRRIDQEEQMDAFLAIIDRAEYDPFYADEVPVSEQEQQSAEIASHGYLDVFLPHSHTPVRVTSSARWFRHGGAHPLSTDGAAYCWCTTCGEILSLDNELARKAWAESEGKG